MSKQPIILEPSLYQCLFAMLTKNVALSALTFNFSLPAFAVIGCKHQGVL